jgi:hypothetical protein
VDDLFNATTSSWRPLEPLPHLVADALDPPWLGTTEAVKDRHIAGRYSGLYNFDAVAYESLIVGVFTIYRCKAGPAPGNKYSALQCPNGAHDRASPNFMGLASLGLEIGIFSGFLYSVLLLNVLLGLDLLGLALNRGRRCPNKGPDGSDLHNHSEFDSIFLGFSRNGFHFSRPGPGEPWPAQGYNLSQQYRAPFAPEASSFNRSRWNWAEVLSYAGGSSPIPLTPPPSRFYTDLSQI